MIFPDFFTIARMLGGGEFVGWLLAEATRREKETLRHSRHVVALATLGRKVAVGKGVGEADRTAGQEPGISTIV